MFSPKTLCEVRWFRLSQTQREHQNGMHQPTRTIRYTIPNRVRRCLLTEARPARQARPVDDADALRTGSRLSAWWWGMSQSVAGGREQTEPYARTHARRDYRITTGFVTGRFLEYRENMGNNALQ